MYSQEESFSRKYRHYLQYVLRQRYFKQIQRNQNMEYPRDFANIKVYHFNTLSSCYCHKAAILLSCFQTKRGKVELWGKMIKETKLIILFWCELWRCSFVGIGTCIDLSNNDWNYAFRGVFLAYYRRQKVFFLFCRLFSCDLR
jgi:hypothetical protein